MQHVCGDERDRGRAGTVAASHGAVCGAGAGGGCGGCAGGFGRGEGGAADGRTGWRTGGLADGRTGADGADDGISEGKTPDLSRHLTWPWEIQRGRPRATLKLPHLPPPSR